jgi:hypothetical protein
MQSDYMYWAKTRTPVRYNLGSSEVPHFRMDRWEIELADLELNGMSTYRDPPLRAAIAAKEGVTTDRVVMADGTSMANMLAMAALIAPGDRVAIEHPAYEPMVAAAAHLGAEVQRFVRQGPRFDIDPDAIPAGCKLIVLTNLHNPTGNLADAATLGALHALAERDRGHVLIDEVYLDAALPAQSTAALLGDRFVCTSSLTKCYGLSGLRCGWILAAPALTERMWRLNELFAVAQAHQAERLSCIALARLDEIAAENRPLLDRNRAVANAFFAGRGEIEIAPMKGGITAFPRLLHGDVDALDARLRADHDCAIVPGRFFGLADHFRIGVGARRRSSKPGSSGSARRWTPWHEEGRHCRILPAAGRSDSPSRDRAQIGQRLHLARRGRPLGPGDRCGREPRHQRPVRQSTDARADAGAGRGGAEAAYQDDRPVQHEGEERHRPLPRPGRRS